jgi:hypothetical protein
MRNSIGKEKGEATGFCRRRPFLCKTIEWHSNIGIEQEIANRDARTLEADKKKIRIAPRSFGSSSAQHRGNSR